MRFDTSTSRNGRAPDLPALLLASTGWLLLTFAPGALSRALDPQVAHAAAFAGIGAWLAAAWRARRGTPARGVAVFVAAALAGYAAAPAWIAGIGWIGLALGGSAPAPAPAGAAPLHWLSAVALGPVVEELVYRAHLLRALRPLGAVAAIGATSLLFALSHRGVFPALAAGCVGVALAAAMWRTGSLAICIGYHGGLNAAALLGGVPPTQRALSPATAAAAGTALAGLALVLARRLRPLPHCAAIALAVPGLAGAEVLGFDAELRLAPLAPSFLPLSIDGAGVATVNGSADGIALETLALDGGIAGTAAVPVTDPTAGGVTTVLVSASLGAGTLRPFQPLTIGAPQLLDATLPVRGELLFCFLFAACDYSVLAVGLDATTASGAAVGVGVGGIVTAYGVGAIRLSLHAAPWTVRTATLPVGTPGGGTLTAFASGWAHGPASFTGSTALAGGELELVTPIRVESSGAGPSLPVFGRLALRFVPEPAPALLWSAGGLAVALAARRRGPPGGGQR